MSKTLIVLAGATATGKTALAISLAQALSTEIISADSRQYYRELNIGVGRPSPEQLDAIRHHFIASHSIHDNVTAASFEKLALETLDKIFCTRDVAIVAGGTGLYINALIKGLDLIPEISSSIRQQIIGSYAAQGLSWLQDRVKEEDPYFYSNGENQNPARLMRALEVVRGTGQSILNFKTNNVASRNFRIVQFNLLLPRDRLHQQINDRVDHMVAQGLFEEVRSLLDHENLQALQTVGYKELFEYYHGVFTKDRAIDLVKLHTRQYAKRQITWFKKDSAFISLDGESDHSYLVDEMLKAAGLQ